MSLLGRPHVEAEVIPASRVKPLVAKQLLDMPDRTAVEQERRRHGMPEHVSGDLTARDWNFPKSLAEGEGFEPPRA